MCDLRVQHRLFCPSTCFFAPVSLVHSLAVWVTLALQNMPPKARAPEARMVFGWDQVSGVEFCTCSGPSRCLREPGAESHTASATYSQRGRARHRKSLMHRYHHALMMSIIFHTMKTIGKRTSVLEFTANRNDGAMRDVLVGCLSPLPHSGSSPSQPPLALCPSCKHHLS